ncbi:hypothetical protein CLV60_10439 [Dyadobacter jiangsuensis]|uniref:Uncharacterized protein n=1 Tax=Dyadobacter jiangsuensis TaxID=1591085 RepID=A0A2P8G804_9BACT|nr:hypothetical protein CLV60_10439 [Dyadobacter jiangsuensis]
MNNKEPLMLTRDHFTEHSSFTEVDLREMASLALKLNEHLSVLLHHELQCGNKIVQVAIDWPNPGSVFVLLDRRFAERYRHDTFEYLEVNDPHYWFAEYSCKHEPLHSVCCRWE